MKLHLPITLRRAVLAVMAVLASSPAMAVDEHAYYDEYKMEGENLSISSDYKSDETYYKQEWLRDTYTYIPFLGNIKTGSEYRYHHHGDSLTMEGTVTNRIETGLFNNGLASPSKDITVNAKSNVKMRTESGVNIIAGNAAELKDTLSVLIEKNKEALGSLQKYSDNIADLLIPTDTKAPTVEAGGAVLMDGPGNAVMLGSEVTGNTITMTNDGTSITSAAAIVGGLLEGIHDYDYGLGSIDIKEKLDPTIQTYLAPLQDIKGNFNIVQGSTIGNADTESVLMHASLDGKTIPEGTSALAANILLGGATVTAKDIDLTGMASVVSNIPFKDAFDKLANSTSGVGIELVQKLLENGQGTKLEATTGDLDLGSEFNVVLGGGADATQGVSLTANAGAVNMTGALNVVGGNTTIKAKDINLVPTQTTTINALANDLKSFIDISSITGGTLADLADQEISAGIVAGGTNMEATNNIKTDGTLGLVLNTPVSDVMSSLVEYMNSTNQDETWMIYNMLQTGTATTLTATNGNIELGAQFNLVHGGGFTETAGENALALTAKNGAVKIDGTFNVVSGNTTVDAQTINMTGERLPSELKDAVSGLINNMAGEIAIPGVSGMLDKFMTKGSVNMVTGGATLTATQGITMNGVANAVFDTEIVDVVEAFMERKTDSLVKGSNKLTTLHTTTGNIDLLGRLNMVNGSYVLLQADAGAVNMQGNLSLVGGGAKVNATNININTDESNKYKMYLDSAELGAFVPADSALGKLIPASVSNVGVNAAVIAGGAALTADQNITIGGTLGLVMNTPMADVMTEFTSYMEHQQETWMVYQLLQKGTATNVTATNGNIELGAQFNLAHGGGFTETAGENALSLSAKNGAVNINGTLNVVSGNVTVDAQTINMTGERLPQDMAGVAGELVDGVAGEIAISGAGDILNKLVTKGHANMVVGGATLTATQGITMNGVANAVFDTEIVDLVEAFMERNTDSLEKGSNKLTTLHTTTGNIDLLGRVNMVNGSYVLLQADAGAVNMQGNLSLVGGGAKVNATNININTDESTKYKMYLDSAELGALVPANSPYTQMINQMGITDKLGHTGVNGSMIAGGSKLTATNNITTGGTVGLVLNTPMAEMGDRLMSLLTNPNHVDEIWMAYELLQKGTATTLHADNNIELGARMNVLHGGNMADANAALALTAGNTVKLDGTLNLVSGNVKVNAQDIELKGGQNVSLNLAPVVDKVMGDSELGGLITGSGLLDKIATKGVNGNMVTGGATLTAQNNIKLDGMANFVLDTELVDVLEAVMDTTPTPLIQGGAYKTTLTATNGNIDLQGRLNVVNGGQVDLIAGKDVNMTGTLNVVSGNADVIAKGDINMKAQNKVGVDISPMLSGHYAELAEEMGMTAVMKNGVSSNLVAGGANLQAEGDIVMSGVATAVVDTTLGQVADAVQQDNLGQLMKGGDSETSVAAKGNIKFESQINAVNGGNAGQGGVVVDAGKDVSMGGQISVVNRANVTAGENVNFTSDLSVVKKANVTAKGGDIAFSGAEVQLNNANLKANTGAVSFTNTHAEMTNGSISAGAGVLVDSSELVNTAKSDVTIDGGVLITNSASLANYGSLSLEDAAVSNATIYNDGSLSVSGTMSLQSATFVITSDTLTLNETGIDLSLAGDALNVDNVPTVFSDAAVADAVAGVNFIISSELLDSEMGGAFELILFENATENDYAEMLAAIQVDEISITLSDLNRDALLSDDIAVEYVNNNIVVTGSAYVPEPSTATLSLLALAALAARRRRR